MGYRVLLLSDFMDTDNDSEVTQAYELAERLNREEADGWTLVQTIQQHNTFGSNPGITGPFFILFNPKVNP